MSVRVELVSATAGTRALRSIKAVRQATDWDLGRAKAAIDEALAGACVALDLADDRADQLVAALTALGWTVRARGTEHPGRAQAPSWLADHHLASPEVLASEPDTDALTLILGPTEVPLEPGDALAIVVDEDFVIAEPLTAITAVPEGWRVAVATHDAEGLGFLTAYFAIGDNAVVVRGAPVSRETP